MMCSNNVIVKRYIKPVFMYTLVVYAHYYTISGHLIFNIDPIVAVVQFFKYMNEYHA